MLCCIVFKAKVCTACEILKCCMQQLNGKQMRNLRPLPSRVALRPRPPSPHHATASYFFFFFYRLNTLEKISYVRTCIDYENVKQLKEGNFCFCFLNGFEIVCYAYFARFVKYHGIQTYKVMHICTYTYGG